MIAAHHPEIPYAKLNGHRRHSRLPGNVNFCFRFIEGGSMLLHAGHAQGVCASSGSACTSGSLDPSHVLLSIGLPHEIAHRLAAPHAHRRGSTTMDDADARVRRLRMIVPRLRQRMSRCGADDSSLRSEVYGKKDE
ncbi:MAG: hypothetical protein ACLUHE_02335 [Christensenellales bacterium]